jgi:hypothetical protein
VGLFGLCFRGAGLPTGDEAILRSGGEGQKGEETATHAASVHEFPGMYGFKRMESLKRYYNE